MLIRVETLKRHIPFSGLDEALEIERMAARFEEMTHSVATSQVYMSHDLSFNEHDAGQYLHLFIV